MTTRSTGRSIGRRVLTAAAVLAGLALALTLGLSSVDAQQAPSSSVRPPPGASVPGGPNVVAPERPGNYDVELWKKVREGLSGQVSIPDRKAGQLVQSDGEAWRNFRNGPLPRVGLWAMVAVVGVLALFFLLRGRIRIEHGWAGRTITRFNEIERIGHWLLAVSFIILALTGLNVLYGRYALLPLIGADAFSAISIAGKWLHNYVAFAFMVGLFLTFVVWIRHNFPSWRDIVWLAKGGGMFVKGSHPPAWKFNAGQKILFWLIMLGGLSLSLSGTRPDVPVPDRAVRQDVRDRQHAGLPSADRADAGAGDAVRHQLARHRRAGTDRGGDRPHLHRHARHAGRFLGDGLGPG